MNTYLAKWPNGTISILTANNTLDAFWKLDVEGDPTDERLKVYRLPKNFYLTTEILKGGKSLDVVLEADGVAIDCKQEFEYDQLKMRRVKY